MSPTLVRPRNRPELSEQFGPRITQEGTVYMDNNTTLKQCSLRGTTKSSRKIVNNNRPWTTKPSYARRTNTQHLEKFQVSVAVTKPVTIATNPSSKLPLAITILIAVEEVNSEPIGFHKS